MGLSIVHPSRIHLFGGIENGSNQPCQYEKTPMTTASPVLVSPYTHRPGVADRYLVWLGFVLLGYALLGRGFAYLGFAPLYIGEITAFLGMVALVATRGSVRVLHLPLVQLLLVFMAWSAVCTVPYIGTHGLDALRDAVLWGYGGFAVIVAGLLIQQPARLPRLLLRYRRWVVVFAALIWLTLLLKTRAGSLPTVPGTTVPIIFPKNGDALAHVGGAGAFIIAGMARANPLLIGLLMLAFVLGNRAGMLACVMALGVASVLTPFKNKTMRFAYGLSFLLILLLLFNPTLKIGGENVSVEQMWSRAQSIFMDAGSQRDQNTRQWRLLWWQDIVDYTVFGPYFWTGKGYGINLSVDDGYTLGGYEDLRSPHNSHLSVLARSGVPGFLLYLLLHGAWLGAMIGHYLQSRRTGDMAWASIFAFIIAYWTALMVNATFDVVLESPMGGIWMWTLFGVGIAAGHLYRHHPDVLTAPADTPAQT